MEILFSRQNDMRDVSSWRLPSEEETILPPVENIVAE